MYVKSTTSPLKCHYKGTLYQKNSTCIYSGLIQMSNICTDGCTGTSYVNVDY